MSSELHNLQKSCVGI